ncbi:MAG: hypothetical protein SFX19_01365 [Alphaproteobacteria bacterium]|nr:hypothetical protein [Alphaproteobacteria bacterium]
MRLRPAIHIVLLIACMQLVSAYKFRCFLFCSEQTGVQSDYIEDRNLCRKYAQLHLDTDTSMTASGSEKARTSRLVSLFSRCMNDKGWTIPEGKGESDAGPPPAVVVPTPQQATAAATDKANDLAAQRREQAFLERSSECAFARHGAAYSRIAATRAEACDIECAEGRKLGKEPAACPAK